MLYPRAPSPARASARSVAGLPAPLERPEIIERVARGARTEGITVSPVDGLRYHRASRPAPWPRLYARGPSVTVVAQGRKVVSSGGTTLSYDASRYFVITSEAVFDGDIVDATPARPFLAVCYEIPPDVVAKLLLCFADAAAEPAPDVATDTAPAYVGPITGEISECVLRLLRAADDPLERRVVTPLVVEELVFRLLRSDAAAAIRGAVGGGSDGDKIRAAMQFFHAHLERPLTVDDVARHVAMSPSHFAHRFRAIARVSPMRYLKQLRLHHARGLIVSAGLRVSEAAARAGYESTSHFTREFRELFGAAPGAYARRMRDR
jgi:AraC-like DNA-binding protein